uniref:BPM/SPOP BACK domain-containing protein n=1 Tax=Hordeum vulgare subsp. vulgare TaxID=112509 RepID=A0A8I6Y5U5_HORVV
MEAKVFRALLCFIYTDSCPEMEKESMEEDEMPGVVEQGQVEEVVEEKMSEVAEQTQDEAVKDEMLLQWLQDLFVAADRYNLQRLKFICEKQLCEHVGVRSVASTLALAEQHHCHGLKEACLKIIQVLSPSCLQTLMATGGWGHIATTYPSVLYELIAMLASNQRKWHSGEAKQWRDMHALSMFGLL